MRRLAILFGTLIALLGAGATSASAAVLCVPSTAVSIANCGSGHLTLDAAIGAAQASTGEADTILIGEGTWDVTIDYNPSSGDTANDLNIAGGPGTDPEDVIIISPDGVVMQLSSADEVDVDLSGLRLLATIDNQVLIDTDGRLDVDTVRFGTNGGAITDTVGLSYGAGDVNVTNGYFDLDDSSNPGAKCVTGGAGVLTVKRTTIRECDIGIEALNGDFFGDRLLITATRFAFFVENADGALTNSVVDSSLSSSIPASISGTLAHAEFVVSQSTFVDSFGNGSDAPIRAGSGNGFNTQLTLTDVIAADFSSSASCEAVGGTTTTITTSYLAGDPLLDFYNGVLGTCTFNQSNSYADPSTAFFEGPGDYRLIAGSPLVDQNPAPLGLGEPAFDFAGNSRIANCKRDLGAYERVAPVVNCTPPPVALPAAVAPAFTGSFKFAKKSVKKGKALKLSYSLTAPGTITFKLKAAKKKNKVPKLKSQAGKAGANSYSLSTKKLKKGKYTLTATLPSGASKSATLTVTK